MYIINAIYFQKIKSIKLNSTRKAWCLVLQILYIETQYMLVYY